MGTAGQLSTVELMNVLLGRQNAFGPGVTNTAALGGPGTVADGITADADSKL